MKKLRMTKDEIVSLSSFDGRCESEQDFYMLFCEQWARDYFKPKCIEEIETFDEWRGIVKTGEEHKFIYFYGDSLFYAVEADLM